LAGNRLLRGASAMDSLQRLQSSSAVTADDAVTALQRRPHHPLAIFGTESRQS
jgi:hypothetical protein